MGRKSFGQMEITNTFKTSRYGRKSFRQMEIGNIQCEECIRRFSGDASVATFLHLKQHAKGHCEPITKSHQV